jgi:hypothetical protein
MFPICLVALQTIIIIIIIIIIITELQMGCPPGCTVNTI